MQTGAIVSLWRYERARRSTIALPINRPRRRKRFDLLATRT
jgi:hypothetical protein